MLYHLVMTCSLVKINIQSYLQSKPYLFVFQLSSVLVFRFHIILLILITVTILIILITVTVITMLVISSALCGAKA